METLEQLKEIVKNAPEKATHVDDDSIYYQYEKADRVAVWREFTENETSFVLNQCICMFGMRSLSEIKLIIELMEAVNSLPDKIETDKWLEGLDRPTEFAISQAKSFAIGSVFDSIRKAKKLL